MAIELFRSVEEKMEPEVDNAWRKEIRKRVAEANAANQSSFRGRSQSKNSVSEFVRPLEIDSESLEELATAQEWYGQRSIRPESNVGSFIDCLS
jgi:hypothetical protein